MGLFSPKRSNPDPSQTPKSEPVSVPPSGAPAYIPDRELAIPLYLDGLALGSKVVITPAGAPAKDSAAGLIIQRESNTRWRVGLKADHEVTVTPRKGEPMVLQVGQVAELTVGDKIKVGPYEFNLPGYGITDLSLSRKQPVDAATPGYGISLKSGDKGLIDGVIELRAGNYREASKRFTAALSKLAIDLDDSGMLIIGASYAENLKELRAIFDQRKNRFNGDMLACPITYSTDEDSGRPALSKMGREMERELCTFLALHTALALREEIRAPLTPVVRNHPDKARIAPETDAILLLHDLGVPLSKFFFVPGLSAGSEERVKARIAAYNLIKSSGGDGTADAS